MWYRFCLAMMMALFATSASAQDRVAFKLCTPELVAGAARDMPDVVPYLDDEDRAAFTQRVFDCRLPSSESQWQQGARVLTNLGEPMSEIATVAGWSTSALGITEGAWIAWGGEAFIDESQSSSLTTESHVNALMAEFLGLEGFGYVPADQLLVSSTGELIVTDSVPRIYASGLPDADPEDAIRSVLADLGFTETLRSEPEFLRASFGDGLRLLFFPDNFVDIRFTSSQIGSRVYVEQQLWGSTALTLQIDRSLLPEVELIYPDGTVCGYDERFLIWLVAEEYAEFSCEG